MLYGQYDVQTIVSRFTGLPAYINTVTMISGTNSGIQIRFQLDIQHAVGPLTSIQYPGNSDD